MRGNMKLLLARAGAGGERHVAPRDAQALRHEFDEGLVGAVVDRRSLHADLQRIAVNARDLAAARTRLDVQGKDEALRLAPDPARRCVCHGTTCRA